MTTYTTKRSAIRAAHTALGSDAILNIDFTVTKQDAISPRGTKVRENWSWAEIAKVHLSTCSDYLRAVPVQLADAAAKGCADELGVPVFITSTRVGGLIRKVEPEVSLVPAPKAIENAPVEISSPVLPKITEKEFHLLMGVEGSDYQDGSAEMVGKWVWSFSVTDYLENKRGAGGVIASLVKKGLLAHEGRGPNPEDHECVAFTALGLDTYLAEVERRKGSAPAQELPTDQRVYDGETGELITDNGIPPAITEEITPEELSGQFYPTEIAALDAGEAAEIEGIVEHVRGKGFRIVPEVKEPAKEPTRKALDASEPAKPAPAKKGKPAKKAEKKVPAKKVAAKSAPAPKGELSEKAKKLIALMTRKNGATNDELRAAANLNPNTANPWPFCITNKHGSGWADKFGYAYHSERIDGRVHHFMKKNPK